MNTGRICTDNTWNVDTGKRPNLQIIGIGVKKELQIKCVQNIFNKWLQHFPKFCEGVDWTGAGFF
jgi:hypothetical protein